MIGILSLSHTYPLSTLYFYGLWLIHILDIGTVISSCILPNLH